MMERLDEHWTVSAIDVTNPVDDDVLREAMNQLSLEDEQELSQLRRRHDFVELEAFCHIDHRYFVPIQLRDSLLKYVHRKSCGTHELWCIVQRNWDMSSGVRNREIRT
eukprot:GHVO01045533.1.p2 GENE.GHVO01045533.1~~GHVO01045533.1.p2  ORF type:complete len:108 (-),score=15.77 GHVO01045533.1:970-1293(-)